MDVENKVKNMNNASTTASSSSSLYPCSPDEVAISPGDCVEEGVEEWLEDETLAGFRVWQLAGIVLSVILAIIIALCCCIRFRIPRTKQDIEADYIRKRITKNFRKELDKINNAEMDEMDLRRALERIRSDLDAESEELEKQRAQLFTDQSNDGVRARFHAMVHGMTTRFSRNSERPTAPKNQKSRNSEV
ncbi:uncharacterized protein [Venturia canescens]|uniref:uncharacterized protein n=1 Tax=Venturia canescens TaxID=32260 RepID=UPI001C9BEB6F|nr:uncharacterized protein LOC122412316 [Venturia canescens]